MNPHQPTPTPTIGVSVKEAARITSASEWVIRNEVNAGRIPAYRMGRRIVIDHDGLTNWLKSHPSVAGQAS